MIICLPADGNSENSSVSSSFGRCPYYAFYDTEKDSFEIVPNPAMNAMSGAGIQAAQFIVNKGADVVLTVNMGPNSGEVLLGAGIKIITGVTGSLRDAVERFKKGEFSRADSGKVKFSEPKHEHHQETPSYNANPDLKSEIKNLHDAVNVLAERTEKLLKRIEKLEE